jgi:hypothetical protein
MHALLNAYRRAGLQLPYLAIPSSPAGIGIQNLAPYMDRIDPTMPLLPSYFPCTSLQTRPREQDVSSHLCGKVSGKGTSTCNNTKKRLLPRNIYFACIYRQYHNTACFKFSPHKHLTEKWCPRSYTIQYRQNKIPDKAKSDPVIGQ